MSSNDQSCEQMSMVPVKKMYYSISEVCRFTGLEPHVLRYWENEFSQLRPKKNRAGNRAYREKDIDLVCSIKRLLYDEKFTILGAKKKLQEMKDSGSAVSKIELKSATAGNDSDFKAEPVCDTISEVRNELEAILSLLRT
ncbi:MAG: MerR family transcriptional regulator [Chitinispirillaceae bacterium]